MRLKYNMKSKLSYDIGLVVGQLDVLYGPLGKPFQLLMEPSNLNMIGECDISKIISKSEAEIKEELNNSDFENGKDAGNIFMHLTLAGVYSMAFGCIGVTLINIYELFDKYIKF